MPRSEKRPQARRPRVALIVETSLASGRDILRGIARYLHAHGPWSIYHEPRALEESVPPWLLQWQGDGIIARIQNQPIADAVVAAGLPVVDVLGLVPGLSVPLVHVDDRAIAQIGAEHLLERGFRHFGFCAVEGANWSDARQAGFEAIVRKAGCDCSICRLPPDTRGLTNWETQQDLLTEWVRSLPKPVGVMVCNDPRGQLVLEAARRADAGVPEQVAVLGVDNDEPLCEISYPPLSSIKPDHVQVGYEGAAILDRMLQGESVPKTPVYIPPAGLVTRLSTDVLAIEDPHVAAAVRFIREYACDGIGIGDIVAHVPLSRSTLQRRFRKVLGCTIHDEILRVRLRRVRQLLVDSELPLESVADRAGFAHRQYLGEVFKAQTGFTLAEYRARP